MHSLHSLLAIIFLSVSISLITAEDKRPGIPAKVADELLRDEPLTIVFRQIVEGGASTCPGVGTGASIRQEKGS